MRIQENEVKDWPLISRYNDIYHYYYFKDIYVR